MGNKPKVSNAIIRRLPRYRRYLGHLQTKGIRKVSSNELSEMIGYTASQIRQDLNTFGEFGQQGYGYNVQALRGQIESLIGKPLRKSRGTADIAFFPVLCLEGVVDRPSDIAGAVETCVVVFVVTAKGIVTR